MKTCSKCGVPKEESEFQRRSDSGKLRGECAECTAKYQANRRNIKPESRRDSDRKYRERNAEKILAASRESLRLNKGEINNKRRARHALNPKKRNEDNKEWVKENPLKVRAAKRRRGRKRYKTDPRYRVECVLRARLLQALRVDGAKKSAATFSLLGCPLVWLEVHLESLFKPNMTWANHGPVWHIDHIKPCAKFDLRDPEQQKACFHWTNLQPLFAEENMKKGASV